MKRTITAACIMLAAGGLMAQNASAQKMASYSAKNKSVKVYVTEKGTDKRMTAAGTLTFEAKPQPVETEVAVFVDPSKTFQTMLGIGGALTDASAETFYK